MDHPQLQELVDAPTERLDVEYKAWLNLDDREARARLAKHLCALANHGGGFVVFGIAMACSSGWRTSGGYLLAAWPRSSVPTRRTGSLTGVTLTCRVPANGCGSGRLHASGEGPGPIQELPVFRSVLRVYEASFGGSSVYQDTSVVAYK